MDRPNSISAIGYDGFGALRSVVYHWQSSMDRWYMPYKNQQYFKESLVSI